MKVKLKSIYANSSGTHSPNEEINVPDDEAKDLIDGGYAIAIGAEDKTISQDQDQDQNQNQDQDQDIIDEIVEAIGLLDPETDYTGGGLPEVKAIEEIIGKDITAAQRDEAFTKFNEAQ